MMRVRDGVGEQPIRLRTIDAVSRHDDKPIRNEEAAAPHHS
jgi:hypothetical protein